MKVVMTSVGVTKGRVQGPNDEASAVMADSPIVSPAPSFLMRGSSVAQSIRLIPGRSLVQVQPPLPLPRVV